MIISAQILGVMAVVAYLLSFQMKKRKNIILVNATSRLLYVLQYVLLGAFEGAVLDLLGMISSVIAKQKESKFIKKNVYYFIILLNLSMVAAGVVLYENIFSIFAILGIILETTALWITKEKDIRILSLVAAPFWLTYNIANMAYGSAFGNALAIISIIIALLRYDIKK